MLFFITARDIDYGVTDQAQYISEFQSPAGPFELDVRCLDRNPTGATMRVRVSARPAARPGDRQAELTLPCTFDNSHRQETYDFGPPYTGSRWVAEINAHRQTRFQVLITRPAPEPTSKAPR